MQSHPSAVVWPLFHYTYERAARSIIDGGSIHVERFPAHLKRMGLGKPAAWFSLNPVMERTARKAVLEPGGTTRVIEPEEQASLIGLHRFVFSAVPKGVVFLPWDSHRLYSGAREDISRAMDAEGRRQGADPSDWYSSFRPVPVKGAVLQVWNKGSWFDCQS